MPKTFPPTFVPARQKRKGELRVYALDRITELSETEQEFTLDPDFDAETFFKKYFGVILGQNVKVERIVLRSYSPNYLRTLPLHHSQREIDTEKEFALFEYYVAPTRDFIQAILHEGHELEVVAPESLREIIRKELKDTLERYK